MGNHVAKYHGLAIDQSYVNGSHESMGVSMGLMSQSTADNKRSGTSEVVLVCNYNRLAKYFN